ncbi:hypothetical protein Nepgr_031473 [Nepenthes gracilis]|uniref:CCT domain-containing protein n=1 Tax=Nepenthes gracilis TaxID=150966 RepID=A0AAD3TGT2_NEPGR|nr:hypothetical protein Nepgr_031473 [Nepenthes gracilis]
MHTEAGILCPYFHTFSHEVQQIEELCHSQKPNSSRVVSTIAEYDLGGEGDLFKAPKPIIEEPIGCLDPVAAAISMMSCDDDIMSAEVLKVGDIETLENQHTVSKVFYEYEKDLLGKTSLEAAVSEVIDIKLPAVLLSEIPADENKLSPELSFQSVSPGCLSSIEWANATSMRPSFLGFSKLDFGSAFGMRRASSEGDIKVSTIAEYDLGGEGDLFKAPKPIIEEPVISLDPIAAAISMMSCDDDIMSAEVLNVGDIETLENQQTVSKVFYEFEKDLLGKTSLDAAVSEVIDIKLPAVLPSEIPAEENKLPPELSFQKSVSSGCLSSIEWANATSMRPSFLRFPKLDFGSAFGMRRAYSEGDIKNLGGLVICSYTSEDRMQKLSRYRNKKSRRNFGRKIKYACRKALADSQPRIRGRYKVVAWQCCSGGLLIVVGSERSTEDTNKRSCGGEMGGGQVVDDNMLVGSSCSSRRQPVLLHPLGMELAK